jgi:hypothetical protein
VRAVVHVTQRCDSNHRRIARCGLRMCYRRTRGWKYCEPAEPQCCKKGLVHKREILSSGAAKYADLPKSYGLQISNLGWN